MKNKINLNLIPWKDKHVSFGYHNIIFQSCVANTGNPTKDIASYYFCSLGVTENPSRTAKSAI